MQVFEQVKQILSDILDVDKDQILFDAYLVRDLDAESIDLLELALELSQAFKIDLKEDDIFLRDLRLLIEEADESSLDRLEFLAEKIAHIDKDRLARMITDMAGGPVLQVGDLVRYLEFVQGKEHAA